jgi:predicted nucleic acid-binding protein
MAQKSGGTIPPKQPIADANQAVALLCTLHHWQATKVNDRGGVGYSVTVTHAGKRVRAYRRTFIDAVIVALAKLRKGSETSAPFMRLTPLTRDEENG